MTERELQDTIMACRYCPMCHHADLVTTLTRTETCSPRGRGVVLFGIQKGKLAWDDSVADVMYQFPADGLSKRVCAGHFDHDEMVIDARRRLVKEGVAPEAVGKVKANLEKTGNPWGEKESDLAKTVGAPSKKGAGTLVYFGPSARVHRPQAAAALAKLLGKAGVAFSYLADEGDSGLLLYQLGENEAAHQAAKGLQKKIEKSGAKEVIVLDADGWRTLSAGFGDTAGLPKSIKVRHATEALASAKLTFKAPGKKIAYHDPCALARFAPCVDPPRALVKAIADADPVELLWNRDEAWCSGECGGLPLTYPAIAKAAAERRLGQARDAGAELLVTASPASAHALAGGPLEVKDLVELASDCLSG